MYKLLIVDDEPLVQVGIKSMLPWESMQIEISGIASNGQAALALIENDMPDIVITDIKMPIMSGLELCRVVNERFGDRAPAFIILTSYEDFELARQALTYRVSDYLVKLELTPEVLRSSIERILAQIEKTSVKESLPEEGLTLYSYHDKFFISLLHNLFENREQFLLQCRELKIDFSSAGYVCCYCEIENDSTEPLSDDKQINLFHSSFQMSKELFSKYQFCYDMVLDLHHFALIFCFAENTGDTFRENLRSAITDVGSTLHNYFNVSLYAGVGTWVTDPLAITESYQYARNAFSNISADCPTAFFDDCQKTEDYKKSFNFAIFKDDLARAYEELDADKLCNTLTEIIDLFAAHPGHHLQALDCASNILYLSISLLPGGEELVSGIFSDSPDNYRTLYKMTTMEQVIDWLTYFRDSLCAIFRERKKDSRKPIVSQVKHYIEEHVTEHLSLNEVAAVFAISPNYLSQLFKKYNDIGYNDYVTQCKIDEARKLLASGEYKVYEVAEMLGFVSAFYFSKVFKKVVGVPPTEYMQK